MKMDVLQALMIAASGFLTVFLMLVLLWLIIVLINKFVTSMERADVQKEMAEETAAAEEPEERLAYVGEIALLNVDEKTAACIMAIVSDETKIPLSQLIFRSIRALD